MAYEGRYRNDRDRYGRGDDDRERGRSEERDYRGAESLGGYGRNEERGEDRDYGRERGREHYGRGESRGVFGGREESSRGYGVFGGSYGGGDQGRSEYGRTDYRRGYGTESGPGSRRDYGSEYGGREYGGSDFGRGTAGRGYGYGEGRGTAGSYGPREGERGFFERAGDEIASWFGSDDAGRRREQDARTGDQYAQHHRGRGPRGYTRSDERIRDDVNDRLTDDPYVDASEIEVQVSKGEVTLSGMVDSRQSKRRAEDIVESISGVSHVQNNLRVRSSSGGSQGGTTSAGASAMAGMSGTGAGGSSTGTGTTGTGTSGTTNTGAGTTGTTTRIT